MYVVVDSEQEPDPPEPVDGDDEPGPPLLASAIGDDVTELVIAERTMQVSAANLILF